MRLVIIESPWAAFGPFGLFTRWRNKRYAQECIADSLSRGEAPLASHILYTPVLRDEKPAERELGLQCGFAWGAAADATIVYEDFGISEGMKRGITEAHMCGRTVEYRRLAP